MKFEFSDYKQEVIKDLESRAKQNILYELLSLTAIVSISIFIGSIIDANYINNHVFINNSSLLSSINPIYPLLIESFHNIFLLLIGSFLIRVFLNFQLYNTRRASHRRTLATALKLYKEGHGDFDKLVEILSPDPFEKIDSLPDSRLKDIIK